MPLRATPGKLGITLLPILRRLGAYGRAHIPDGGTHSVSMERLRGARTRPALLVHPQACLDGDVGLALGPPASAADSHFGGRPGLYHGVCRGEVLAISAISRL